MENSYPIYPIQQEQRLLFSLLSPWRRRGARLLHMGLTSVLPSFFWEAGFDVSALDSSPDVLARARAESGPKIDYHLGQPDHVPFDDGSFDYVVLSHLLPRLPFPFSPTALAERRAARVRALAILSEAQRVASMGITVLEWNRLSLARFSQSPFPPGQNGQNPYTLSKLLRQACPQSQHVWRSTLLGPTFTWRNSPFWNLVTIPPAPLPFGALVGLRLELNPLSLTPVQALHTNAQMPVYSEEPLMNRISKSS